MWVGECMGLLHVQAVCVCVGGGGSGYYVCVCGGGALVVCVCGGGGSWVLCVCVGGGGSTLVYIRVCVCVFVGAWEGGGECIGIE